MNKIKLATRQVHLDFHTSEFMPGVGSRFSKENFQKALKLGNVNSITIFAKCHHSWCYYPSKVGTQHPTLNIDLTGEMLAAAHEIGVKAPLYITTGWSSHDADAHPEWIVKDKNRNYCGENFDMNAKPEAKKPIVSWKLLCLNGPYKNLLYALTEEICERYPVVDGLFYDISLRDECCYCDSCVQGMKEQGYNVDADADVKTYFIKTRREVYQHCWEILHKRHPQASIFHNGAAEQYRPEYMDLLTHFELEDLPTTWGGYDKLPPRAKFMSRFGKDYLGMSGKFHTMWGEFGGFKNPEALRFECAMMMTYGAKCSVGDQMHPCGEMDLETYRTIGQAYDYVKKLEDYCDGVEETTRLGIVLSGAKGSDEGLVKMLLENQYDFDVVLADDDLSRFDTIILPDAVKMDLNFSVKLKKFIENGGGVLLSGVSGLDEGKFKFMLDIGARYQGSSEFENDYVLAGSVLAKNIVKTPFLFYEGAEKVSVTHGEVLATIKEPYFNRTYGHYCSHQNTPNKLEDAQYPACVKHGNVVYFAHSIFKMYFLHGAQYHRDYVINALKLIYKRPILEVNLPSAGRARLVWQAAKNRNILHLLYGSPIQRGRTSVIEDLPSILNTKVSIIVQRKINKVTLVPQVQDLQFSLEGDVLKFCVPEFSCHQAIVIS